MNDPHDEMTNDSPTSCEWYEASIAASMYERIPHEERSHVEAHLLVCAACRELEADLRKMVAEIPRGKLSEDIDLWPALEARLAMKRRPRWFNVAMYGAAAAAFLLVAGIGYVTQTKAAPDTTRIAAQSATQQAITLAKDFEAKHDFAGALKTLQHALAEAPGAPDAGAAQQALAELEFSHGQRYAEAYAAYETLKLRYPDAWMSTPHNPDRLDLLAEAKTLNFEPLYALNAAKNSNADAFGQLEHIAARQDTPMVAALAVDAMRELVGGPDSASGAGKVAALEKARDRCTDPVAGAQIKMALANTHWLELRDAATARALYGEVASTNAPLVAQAARDALAKLDAGR